MAAVSPGIGSQLGELLPIPCSSSEALWADQAHRGDRIRRKMRKIIGRSDLIMATPVKNKLLIGVRAIWWVFKVKCESTHYLSQAMAGIASAFIRSVESWHKASWLFVGPRHHSNEPLKNHYRMLEGNILGERLCLRRAGVIVIATLSFAFFFSLLFKLQVEMSPSWVNFSPLVCISLVKLIRLQHGYMAVQPDRDHEALFLWLWIPLKP